MPIPPAASPLRRLHFPRQAGRLHAVPFHALMGWGFGNPDSLVFVQEKPTYWMGVPAPPGAISASVGASPVTVKKTTPGLVEANPRFPVRFIVMGTAVR